VESDEEEEEVEVVKNTGSKKPIESTAGRRKGFLEEEDERANRKRQGSSFSNFLYVTSTVYACVNI